MPTAEDFTAALGDIMENPMKALYCLTGEEFRPKQIPFVMDIWNGYDTTMRKAHGVGGTWVSARMDYLMYLKHPGIGIVVTAPAERQVKNCLNHTKKMHFRAVKRVPMLNQLKISEIPSQFLRSPDPDMHNWYIAGVAPRDVHKIESYHSEKWMIYHVDETKGVKAEMFPGMDGGLTEGGQRVFTSVPGEEEGEFWEACENSPESEPNDAPRLGYWRNHVLDAHSSPDVNQEWIDMMIRKWGKDSAIVAQKVHADFASMGSDALIPAHSIKEARFRKKFNDDVDPEFGFDTANVGRDYSVVITGHGRDQDSIFANTKSVMPAEVARWAMRRLTDSFKKRRGHIDVGGGGIGSYEEFIKAGWKFVKNINFGSNATTLKAIQKYENIKAQGYDQLAESFIRGDITLNNEDPYCDDLCDELKSIKASTRTGNRNYGKIYIIDPPGKSPDFADALMLQQLWRLPQVEYSEESKPVLESEPMPTGMNAVNI